MVNFSVQRLKQKIHNNGSEIKLNKKITKQANIIKYKRGSAKMLNSSQLDTQLPDHSTEESKSQQFNQLQKYLDKKLVISTVIATVLSTIILTISSFIINEFNSPKKAIADLREIINENTIAIAVLQTEIDNIHNDIARLDNRMNLASETDNSVSKLYPTKSLTTLMDISIQKTSTSMPTYLSAPTWGSYDIIAKDSSGNDLTSEELINKKLLLSYESNGQEVFFYGQYNANNQWDGRCIINVYEQNKLILITEAIYENGIIQSYKQVLVDDQLWIISDRINKGNYNSGSSWRYNYKAPTPKKFDINTVVDSDILTVDTFKDALDVYLEGYYYGNTSNGLYNDDTGTAYLIKYAPDGTVRTLYCGNFKNGHFEDDTGNAWYITRNDETNTNYMYFKGIFVDNRPSKNSVFEFENNLTLEKINSYLSGRKFNSEIIWAETESIRANQKTIRGI